jgi:hypothetical protein
MTDKVLHSICDKLDATVEYGEIVAGPSNAVVVAVSKLSSALSTTSSSVQTVLS